MTKGCVAIGDLSHWHGILIPADAHFHKTGVEIRNYLKHQKDLFAFANELITHPTWSSFRAKKIGGKDRYLGIETNRLTDTNTNPLYYEYIYVIDPATGNLHLLGSKHTGNARHEYYHVNTLDITTDKPPLLHISPKDVLELLFYEHEEGYKHGKTICEYLIKLLSTLWQEQSQFNSKRPLGDSGWNYDIYTVLIRNGIVDGAFDDNGFISDIDKSGANNIIQGAINALSKEGYY